MIKELLDPNSDVSSMRVMSFIALFIAGGLAFTGLIKGVDLSALGVLCGVFVASSFGGKSIQAFAESKKRGDGGQ